MSNFDLRIPIGLFFSLIGLALTIYGFLGDKALNERSLGININLVWGIVLLVFGVLMLVFTKKGKPQS